MSDSNYNPMESYASIPKHDDSEDLFEFKKLIKTFFPEDYKKIDDFEKAYTEFNYYKNDILIENETYAVELETNSDIMRFAIGKINDSNFESELKAELLRVGNLILDDTRFSISGRDFLNILDDMEIWSMRELIEFIESKND